MAGQTDRSSAGQTGPTARRPGAGRPRPADSQAGDTAAPIDVVGAVETVSAAPMAPDILPRMLQTQAAYRLLVTSGVSSLDAAGLIGYVLGLPACDSRWSLAQINRLLFLRSLYTESKWGEAERQPTSE
jgi:hypothetical protein